MFQVSVRAAAHRPQVFWVEVGGDFLHTSGLSALHWGYSRAFGLITFPLGVIMRLIPVKDRESDLAGYVYQAEVERVTTSAH